jgi:hypothetical protein
MVKALDPAQFSNLQRRYQNVMLGLLAIEQMTGAIAPPPVILESQSGSNTTNDVVKIQEQITANRKNIKATEAQLAKKEESLQTAKDAKTKAADDLKKKQEELATEKKTVDDLKKKEELAAEKKPVDDPKEKKDELTAEKTATTETSKTAELTTAVTGAEQLLKDTTAKEKEEQETVNLLKQELDGYNDNQDTLERALKNSKNMASNATASGKFGSVLVQSNRPPAEQITAAVKEIVKDVLKADGGSLAETCLELLNGAIDTKSDLFRALTLTDPSFPERKKTAKQMVDYCNRFLERT